MSTNSANTFELNPKDESHVSDAGHASIVRQRRERLKGWVENLAGVPAAPAANKFQDLLCYSPQLNHDLQTASERLKRYAARSSLRRPFNVYLSAPPGSGKSTLVRSLCTSLGVPKLSQLIEINFSNLLSPEGAIAVFERLVLLKENGLLPVVFFDEVDAPAWSVYQFMLMPMWDGACVVRGMPVTFGKAIFFFAGSRQTPRARAKYVVYDSAGTWVRETARERKAHLKSGQAGKEPDFYSRIDLTVYMPPAHGHFQDEWDGTKGVYWQDEEALLIAASMIKRYFPQAVTVDRRVLLYLAGAMPESRRELDRVLFIASMDETQTEFEWDTSATRSSRAGRGMRR